MTMHKDLALIALAMLAALTFAHIIGGGMATTTPTTAAHTGCVADCGIADEPSDVAAKVATMHTTRAFYCVGASMHAHALTVGECTADD